MNKREFHANSGPLNSSTGALFSTQYDFKGGYKLRKLLLQAGMRIEKLF